MTATPRYATQPTPGAPHELAQILAVARMIKYRDDKGQLRARELAEHQRLMSRVVSERTMDGTRWRYPVVVLGLPRRTGKTVEVETVEVQRSLMYPGHGSYYTAQRLTDAWQAWHALVDMVQDSPLLASRVLEVRESMSGAALTWRNGAIIAPFTPGSEKALDGKNADLIVIDEAFALPEAKAELMMQSITPTQLNRPNGQLWIISAAGTAESTWFRRWVELGRSKVNDPDARIAIFDYGLRDGGDPYDPAEWAAFHPGYGVFTNEAGMRDAIEKSTKQGFLRGYCNVWPDQVAKPFLDPDAVRALGVGDIPLPSPADMVVAVEVAADASAASLVAAWTIDHADPDTGEVVRLPVVVVIERGPGVHWIAPSLHALQAAGATIVADDHGKTAVLLDTLPAGLDIQRAGADDVATASQALIMWTPQRRWRWLDNDMAGVLLDQLAKAVTRRTPNGAVLDPERSTGPIDTARAAALAALIASQTKTPPIQLFV